MARPRDDLSPSNFTDEDHDQFVQIDTNAFKEAQVVKHVLPIIEGNTRDLRYVSGQVKFKNLAHLTDGTLVPGNPDLYEGARPEQLDRRVRTELNDLIIPTTQKELPFLPNFVLAAKAPSADGTVAFRQASYDGALGARAMHALQSYGQDQVICDEKAYTITSAYHLGVLRIFASLRIQSDNSPNRPEYSMTQLGSSFVLPDNPEQF